MAGTGSKFALRMAGTARVNNTFCHFTTHCLTADYQGNFSFSLPLFTPNILLHTHPNSHSPFPFSLVSINADTSNFAPQTLFQSHISYPQAYYIYAYSGTHSSGFVDILLSPLSTPYLFIGEYTKEECPRPLTQSLMLLLKNCKGFGGSICSLLQGIKT